MNLSPLRIFHREGSYRSSTLSGRSRLLRTYARWICCVGIGCLLAACDPQQESRDPNGIGGSVSKDLVWSFMVNDSMPDARIRKWGKPALRGLMIVDQSRTEFFRQFAPLLRQVGENIDVKIDVCQAVATPDGISSPSEPNCEDTGFDFYFVITNGKWTESDWQEAKRTVGVTAELLGMVRELLATESKGNPCRYAIGTNKQIYNQIEGAISIVDSEQPIALGVCGTHMFLNMMGLYPLDGEQPLDPPPGGGELGRSLA